MQKQRENIGENLKEIKKYEENETKVKLKQLLFK